MLLIRGGDDFLDRALVWVLAHIPGDTDTIALEATVTVVHERDWRSGLVLWDRVVQYQDRQGRRHPGAPWSRETSNVDAGVSVSLARSVVVDDAF